MKTYLLALAFTFISCPVLVAAASSPEEIESITSSKNLYLVLDVSSRELQVCVRGLSLDTVSFRGVRAVRSSGAHTPDTLEIPQVWKVVARTPAENQRVNASTPSQPPASGSGEIAPPHEYEVVTDSGWVLAVGGAEPEQSWVRRITASIRESLSTLTDHESPDPPPRVELDVTPEDAARVHHLFRPGTALIVVD